MPFLLPAEQEHLSRSENPVDFAYNQCVHTLFEEQAERTPDSVAVEFGGSALTYAELNTRSNQLAHYLRARGAGPDVLVGLYLERSLEMVVGLLGILKAGSAYVPLDPSYPSERLSQMVLDSHAPLLVTRQALKADLPPNSAEAVCLDLDREQIERQRSDNPVSGVGPYNLVYVIYTSGSTGAPKGTAVYHRGFSNLVQWFISEFGFVAADRTLLLTSISFDLTQKNVYGVLCVGGRLHLAPAGIYDPAVISSKIESGGITHLNCTPSHFSPLVSDPGEAVYLRLSSLRYVYLGGEPIELSHLTGWLDNPHCRARLVNSYGPTECSDVSTFYVMPKNQAQSDRTLPIGRPIPHVTHYVLDKDQNPVDLGVPGELYIGGAGVGHGYVNRPDLTAERFLPDPFGGKPGARFYRTGDLVRYLPDGNIEFLDRLDNQVKIRGFRIELGEVESVLLQHPDVRESVVVAREDFSGDKRLVGYAVVKVGQQSTPSQLRGFLAGLLPDYMIPPAIVILEQMPLSPNGKIDRKALPAPDSAALRARPGAAPRNGLEIQLAQIWENALGIRLGGIDDNFFEIGGHSLLAGRIFASIAQTLGKDLPLTSLVEAPTVRQQAELLQRVRSAEHWRSLVALKTGGSRAPIFGMHAGQGTVLFYRHLARWLHPDQPFYGLQQQGLDGKRTAILSVEDMAAHYIKEIRTIQPHGPYHLIGYCFGGMVAFEMAQRLVNEGEEIGLLAMVNAPSPDYDFSKGAAISPDTPDEMGPASDKAAEALRLRGQRLRVRIKATARWNYRHYRHKAAVRVRRCVPLAALALGVTIPWNFRRVYASRINDGAQRRYTALPYPGKMLVIRGAEKFHEPTTGWGGRALQGLDLYEIDGRHDLLIDLMMEPHVQKLAEILEKAIGK